MTPEINLRFAAVAAATAVAALTAAAAAALAVAGFASQGLENVGMGVGSFTTVWTAGSCHRLDQLVETDPMFASDTSPAVPCTSAHQSETYVTEPITGAVAAQAERPSPQWLQSAVRGACGQHGLGAFFGEQPPDVVRDISVLRIVPSVTEWRAGVRRVRCDALIGPRDTQSIATISTSLKGIEQTAADRFRVCRLGFDEVSCSALHQAELVNPAIRFTNAELKRDHAYQLAKVRSQCQAEVAAYLGASLSSRTDIVLKPELPGDYPHTDSRVGHCWIGPADPGRTITGSLRRAKDGRPS